MSSDGQSEVNKILNDQNKKVSEATGILSKIFRKTLAELNVTPMKWNILMNSYLDDPRNRVSRNSKERSSARGNLNKELNKANMTWLNFQKGVKFLRPKKARFSIELEWWGGKTTIHDIVMISEDKQIELEENDNVDE